MPDIVRRAAAAIEAAAGALSVRSDSMDIEVRDPRGATQAATWTGMAGRPQVARWDAAVAIDEGFKGNWLVNRAVQIIADRISSLPIRVGTSMESPEDFEVGHPLARLLGPWPARPNPEASSSQLIRNAVISYFVTGRFAFEIERNRDQIVGLWPLVVANLAPIPSGGGRRYFSGYEYRVIDRQGIVDYSEDEVAYCYAQDPSDPRQAFSRLIGAAVNASVVHEVDLYHYAFMKNNAMPASIITHGPFRDPADRAKLRRQIISTFRGATNAGKTAFAEVGVGKDGNVAGMLDVKTVQANARDSQLAQIYEQQLRAVSGGLGVPMSLLDASGRTFDNAKQEGQWFYQNTLLPLLTEIQDNLNREIAVYYPGYALWFDISKVEELKPTRPQNSLSTRADYTVDEVRAMDGYGPSDKAALAAQSTAPPAVAPVPVQQTAPALERNDGVRADAPTKRGTMVALYPDRNAAETLALAGGEKPDDLHVTLAYLPDFNDADLSALHGVVQRWAADQQPLAARVSGKGQFHPSEDDGDPVTYASIDAPGLAEARTDLVARLGAAGHPVSTEHGFTPHMTLKYGKSSKDVPEMPLSFGHAVVAHNDNHAHFHFTASPPAEPEQPRRERLLPGLAAMLDRQLANVDAKITQGMTHPSKQKRARQAEVRGEDVVTALFDHEHWVGEMRAALVPVCRLAAMVANEADAVDVSAWADLRADQLASQLVACKELELRGQQLSARSADMVAALWDEAATVQTGVPVKDLLARIRAGEMDWDTSELETSR